MNRYIKLLALMGVLAAGLFALAGCSDKKDEPTPGPDPVEPVNTTVLVYMAASNSLGVQLNDSMDIKEMQRAARAGHLNGGRLLIYHAGYKTAQTLSEITADGKILLIKEYGADGIIYEQMKFCDPWAYEKMVGVHVLREDFGYPVLALDRPYASGGSGQIRTRVQAFVESVEIKKLQGGAANG